MTSSHPITPRYVGPDTSTRTEKMTRTEIQNRFDQETASAYSQREPVWLPDFKELFGLIPQLIAPYLHEGSLVLDVGAGTGNLTRSVLEAFPQVKAVLMDFSANMLSEAPIVLAQFAGRYETLTADFIDADFAENKYSAVVSSFAIHHCRGAEEYLRVYRKIFNSLQNDGIFACVDVVAGADEKLTLLNENAWRSFLLDQGLLESEVQRILSNYHVEDSPIDLWSHLELLKQTGFSTVDVAWKRSNFAVYAGVKQD